MRLPRRALMNMDGGRRARVFRWSLKMNTWSRPSVLTDPTKRSAMPLVCGDLTGAK